MEWFTFWDGPLSQWEPAYFVVEGVEYNCAEQFMMAEKARFFEDFETLELILEADDPRTQKRLGRVVDGFDRDLWEEEEDNGMPRCWNIVRRGNLAKFAQNEHLREALLETEGTRLVEASPDDEIWGIGRAADDPLAREPGAWLGLNWLGEVLEDVREVLQRGDTELD